MSRHYLVIFYTAFAMTLPAAAQAQAGKERFLLGLEQFSHAMWGTSGDEGPALIAALATMRAGLEEWDAQIAAVQSRFNAEVASAPPSAAARMNAALGSVYLERGRIADAIARLDAAPRLDPSFTEVHVLRALAYEAAGRSAEAAGAHRAMVVPEGGNDPAHAYLFLRDVRVRLKADTTSDEVRQEADTTAVALRDLLGVVERGARKGGPMFTTGGLIDDAAAAAPVFPPAAYADAVALLRSGQYDAAVERLAAAVASDPLVTDPGLNGDGVRAAIAALKQTGGQAQFAALAEAASRLDSGQLHRIAGIAYSNAGQYPEALDHLGRAVRLDPLDDRARLALADALVASGDPVAARDALRSTAKALPTSGLAQWKLGRLAQSVGDEREALQAFDAAAEHPPLAGASHVYAAIGRLHHNHLALDAAAAAYGRRVRLVPNDPDAHADLGDVHRSRGALEAAMAEFAIAALLDPANTRALASLGQMHAAAGRDDAAVVLLQRVTALDGSHAEARYALSRALMRLGRNDEAQRELQIFERLQAQAMEEERRRFRKNQVEINEVLKAGEPAEPGR